MDQQMESAKALGLDPVQAETVVENEPMSEAEKATYRGLIATGRETSQELLKELEGQIKAWRAIAGRAREDGNVKFAEGYERRADDADGLCKHIRAALSGELDLAFLDGCKPPARHYQMPGRRAVLVKKATERMNRSGGLFPRFDHFLAFLGFILDGRENYVELCRVIEMRFLHFSACANLKSGALPLGGAMNAVMRASRYKSRAEQTDLEMAFIARTTDALAAMGAATLKEIADAPADEPALPQDD